MSFPNESPEYRVARAALLASEMALRRRMEAVAAQLRALPPAGEVPEDYVFDATGSGGAATVIRMSELFLGGDTLNDVSLHVPARLQGRARRAHSLVGLRTR
jgi:predicted dithiol-disulfide oxidoreductase (DUF899 family)